MATFFMLFVAIQSNSIYCLIFLNIKVHQRIILYILILSLCVVILILVIYY